VIPAKDDGTDQPSRSELNHCGSRTNILSRRSCAAFGSLLVGVAGLDLSPG
jgi:hypothetical protein